MHIPATHPVRQAWLSSAALALALIACAAAATSAQAAGPRLRFARCFAAHHRCHAVVPQGSIVLGGSGFQRGMLAVFTIERGGWIINATRNANIVGPHRVRTHVPSDAVTGPVYLISATGRSNALELNVHGTDACPSTPGTGDAVTRWTPVVMCVLGMLHQPQTTDFVNDTLIIIRGESGGDPAAINNWDSNAQAGDPSRGLMQVIGATFAAYRSPLLPDDIFDPPANIYAGLAYGIARYGSIPNIPGVKSVTANGPYRPYKTAAP